MDMCGWEGAIILSQRNFEKKHNSMKIESRQFLLGLVAFIGWQNLKHIRCSVNHFLVDVWRREMEGNKFRPWEVCRS